MNAFRMVELSKRIGECDVTTVEGRIKQDRLCTQLLIESGGKINALGEWYWEDEYGIYYPTESGRRIYTKLKEVI